MAGMIRETRVASRASVWAGMICIYLVWGSTYLASRVALRTMPPFLMTGVRSLIAGGLLYALCRLKGDEAPAKETWKTAGIVGLLMICGGSGLVAWAQLTVPSGIAALLIGAVPLWLAVLDLFGGFRTKHHRPRPLAAIGLVLGFFGIVLLVGPSALVGLESEVNPLGAAAILLGGLSWAFGSLKSREAVLPASRALVSSIQLIGGGLGLLVVGGAIGEFGGFDPRQLDLPSVLGFLYLTFFGSIVGFSVYSWLLRSAPTTLVSTYAYVNPIVALFLGWLVLDETIGPRVVSSGLIILIAVAMVTLNSNPPDGGEKTS